MSMKMQKNLDHHSQKLGFRLSGKDKNSLTKGRSQLIQLIQLILNLDPEMENWIKHSALWT